MNVKMEKTAQLALMGLGLMIVLSGLFVTAGGIHLMSLGGSWYFAPAGMGLAAAGVLIVRRRPAGLATYLLVFAVTVVWSILNAGLEF